MRILESEIHATTDVHGIANTFKSLPLVQAAAKIDTRDDGPIISIFSHYAQHPDDGPTIHSKGQMESFGLLIDDKSHVIGGMQCIVTNEGYVMPLHICNGLPYMSMSPPTDADMASFPNLFFCSDSPWDPSYLDREFDATESEIPAEALACCESNDLRLDDYGRIVHHTTVIDHLVETCSYYTCSAFTIAASTAYPNGLPLILSSLMCPPMMMVSLAMVDAPCCSSMEVSTPTSLLATPCRQKLPCPKLLKILFVIIVP